MDEQTTQQAITNPEPTSIPEPSEPEIQEPTQPEPQVQPEAEPEPEISLSEDGELKFRDDFFGEVEPEKPSEPELQETPPAPPDYTEDELLNTPYEQWEPNRIKGDVKKYIPIVQQQIARRRAAAEMQQMQERANEAPPLIQQPKDLTPKDLANEAQQLAVQKLNLENGEDFDSYDPEHQAAYNIALQEIQERYNAERVNYIRQVQEYQSLNNFNMALTQQADFPAFRNWFDMQLRQRGITGEQINARFQEHVKNGGRYSDIQGAIAKWYQDFRNFKSQQVAPKPTKAPKAPYLESSYGAGDATGKNINFRNLGELDDEGVANFLMKNGYV